MSQVSSVLRRSTTGYSHWCPGCREMHHIHTDAPNSNGAQWSFDGNAESPTFTPSVNISSHDEEDGTTERCHYNLTAGVLNFCGDSTHSLAGQPVPLPPLPSP